LLCECMRVARSGYYAWKAQKSNPVDIDAVLIKKRMRAIFDGSDRTYGVIRIRKGLRAEGIICNHKKVRRLMKELNIVVKVKRRFKATTNSKHNFPIEPDLLQRQFSVLKPNVSWVGDITYIPTDEGWLYLAVVIDLYSRKVKGWAMSERMTADLAISALEMALNDAQGSKNVLLHSDRGSQYASYAFKEVIKKHHMIQSMSRKGNCWDNSVAESFFGHLKQERVQWQSYQSRLHAQQDILNYIAMFYNPYRLHSYLGYLSPQQFESQEVNLQKVA